MSALWYTLYVSSPHWKQLRKFIIEDRGKQCESCGDSKGSLILHHLTYRRIGWEVLDDVILLCIPCHYEAHLIPSPYQEILYDDIPPAKAYECIPLHRRSLIRPPISVLIGRISVRFKPNML